MIVLRLHVDARPFQRAMTEVERRQIPFATAVALTRTAHSVRMKMIGGLGRTFIIRSQWLKKGWRVEAATKTKHAASVGSLDRTMLLQEIGGVRRPFRSRSVAVPKGARPTPTAITRPSKWPGKLLKNKARFFTRPSKYGYGTLVFRRMGSLRKRPGTLRLMWVLKGGVELNPRLGLRDTTAHVVATEWPTIARRAFEDALTTTAARHHGVLGVRWGNRRSRGWQRARVAAGLLGPR